NRLESYRVGADDYVAKPYTPAQIFEAMASARSWCGSTADHIVQGMIPLDPATEEDLPRLCARLRNALVARTTLDPEGIANILAVLREVIHDCLGWGRRTGQAVDATVGFVIRPDHLTITLEDASGWLDERARADPIEQWPAFRAATFDQAIIEEPGRRI